MASQKYVINWSDDSLKKSFTISEKRKDNRHSSLTLIGGGSMDWGKEYQENLIHMLENFASNAKPPRNPTVGQTWFDSSTNYLKIYSTDKSWVDLKNRRIDSVATPVGKFIPGDLWFDSSKGHLKVYLNEGVWSDPMSGSIQQPRPIPVPAPTYTPTPASPVSPTPVPTGTPTPTPAPVTPTPTPSTYTMPAHKVVFYGPDYVWGSNGGTTGNPRVFEPVPQLVNDAFPQLTVVNEGVVANNVTKLLNGTDGVHWDWDYEMSQSNADVIVVSSFGYFESKSDSSATFITTTEWQNRLISIAQIAKQYNKLLIFVSMHSIDQTLQPLGPYNVIMSTVAESQGVGYIDMLAYTASMFTGLITNWLPDGVTPTQDAYKIISQRIISQYPIIYKKLTSIETPQVGPKPFGQDAALYPTLTFQEEFSGSSLPSSLWSLGNWWESANSLANYSVGSGALTVWAKQNGDGTWEPHNFTCTTDEKFYQKYGYFEIEAKLPYGSGVWPAFWMYCHDDSTRPEINFMQTWPSATSEFYGDANFHPRNYVASATNPSSTLLGERKLLGSLYNNLATAPDLSAGFHKYGVRWDKTGVQFYFDGQPLGSKILSNAMTYRMFFVIDLWIGGKAVAPDASIPTTADRGMVVRYLRAWALNDGSTEVSGSSVTSPIPVPTPTSPTPVTPTPTSGIQPFGQSGSYSLTFSDEFDSGTLNLTKWNDHIWYETSDPTINYGQENGSLKIWPASGFVPRTIDTDGKFSQVYGYFEMEAKLPYGKGLWPAFWLYAHPDAGNKSRPEIDIMEAYSGGGVSSGWSDSNLHPTNYGASLHKANADYSYHDVAFAKKLNDFFPAVDLSAGFHKYGVKWETNGITFYFDGQPLGTKWVDDEEYFDQPMYILLDLWYGSASGTPDSSTPLGKANSFEIRYVRAWKFGSSSVPTPTVTPAPTVPTPVGTPTSPAPTSSLPLSQHFHVGMHSHRVFQGGGSPEPSFNLGVWRDWDCEGLHCADVWLPDGSINVNLIKGVYDGYAAHGAKVIKCFGTVPQWAAKRPNEQNASYPSFPGGKSGPRNLDEYEDYCYRFISTFKNNLWAVEGWNEPYGTNTNPFDASADNPQFTSMTATELADAQKRVWLAAKRVDPNMVVISPAQSYLNTIPQLLQAKTSQGEPIYNFFDVLGAHLYNHTADGAEGPRIADEAATIRGYMHAIGINKPIADTEHGWLSNGANYNNWVNASSDRKGRILYDTAKAAKDAGIVALCYYSYDSDLMGHPDTNQVVASWMGNAYKDWDTRWGVSTTIPGSTPVPVPGPTPVPTPAPGFYANVTIAPTHGSNLTGTVTFRIEGSGIVNAELLPMSGYTPRYGQFSVASDGTFAVLSLNTAQISNGQYQMRILAWNVPAGSQNGQEIIVMPARTYNVSNAVPTPTPTPVPTPTPTAPTQTIIVDYYGDSTVWGVDGLNGGRVANPAPKVFASQNGYTTRNEGVSGTTTTQLLNGTDGVHSSWTNQMANSNATHVIINHGINDWQLDENGYKANLQQLITIARNRGKKVILETPNPTYQALSGGSTASDQEVARKAQYMREIGFTMNVGIIDQFQMLTEYMAANGLGAHNLCPDGLHPTQTVYTLKGQYAATRFNVLK